MHSSNLKVRDIRKIDHLKGIYVYRKYLLLMIIQIRILFLITYFLRIATKDLVGKSGKHES